MPVQTRSMTNNAVQKNSEVPEKKSVKNMTNNVENRSTTIQENISTNLFVYKDDTTGIEYITKEQIEMRRLGHCCDVYTPNNTRLYGLFLYDKITEIHPNYRRSIPKEVADRKDLFALAPEGYLWKEDESTTSYFHWDEWKRLKKHPHKRERK